MSYNFTQKDIDKNKNLALLSYIGFLFVIPMYFKKNSDYANFHAKQGKVLFIIEFIVFAIKILNEQLFINIVPLPLFIGIGTFTSVLVLLVFSLAVFGVINVVKGESKKLPLIGGLSK